MDEQERVAAFVDEHDLGADPAYRLLDLVAGRAPDGALAKYRERIDATGDPGSDG